MTTSHNEMKIFTGNAHPDLARRICDSVGVQLGDATVTAFADGESKVRINEDIRGRDIFIVQPTSQPANEHIMELLILVDAIRRASASRITAVVPFFGYARQDRKDRPRVPITAKLVANLLVAAGVNRVLTVDLHAQQIQGFFDIPVDHLYARPVFMRYLRTKKNLDPLVVCSPDVGGLKMAESYAQALGVGLATVAKRRKSDTEVDPIYLIGEVKDMNVFLVDDLTSTAGTLTSAARICKENGAREVFAGVSHAVLGELGFQRVADSDLTELITTNSTPVKPPPGSKIEVLCIASLLGEGIKRIHNDESVSSLFET